MSSLYQLIKDTKFSEKNICPHCGESYIIKYGKYKARQRYLCKCCGATFNDNTATFISGTHYPEKWQHYLQEMLRGTTLRAIAINLKISYVTAFYWRHKILKSLEKTEPTKFRGIIELTDFTVPYNRKGKKGYNLIQENIAMRNSLGALNIPQDMQIKVICAQDRYCNYFMNIGKRNQRFEDLLNTFIPKIAGDNNKICSSYNNVVKRICAKYSIEFKRGTPHQLGCDLYHIKNIFNYKTKFLHWIMIFKGVASHYFQRYCDWYNIIYCNDFAVTEMFAENLARKCIENNKILTYKTVISYQ